MKLSADLLGASAGPRPQEIDARWLMAYAAALGETSPEYLDTTRPGGILAHPLFPVCYEWPLLLDLRATRFADEIALRGVHATHDLVLHRAPRAGERLHTTAAVTVVEPRSVGTYVVVRVETVDAHGHPVSTTDYGSLYLGIACEGAPAPRRPPAAPARASSASGAPPALEEPAVPPGDGPWEGRKPDWTASVPIAAGLAHLYSECARIWNPIHTDRAVALAAGLPDIILHGTATLALAVSEVLRREGGAERLPARRIGCRFGGMVRLPSVLGIEGWRGAGGPGTRLVRFRALTADGAPAVRDGRLLAG